MRTSVIAIAILAGTAGTARAGWYIQATCGDEWESKVAWKTAAACEAATADYRKRAFNGGPGQPPAWCTFTCYWEPDSGGGSGGSGGGWITGRYGKRKSRHPYGRTAVVTELGGLGLGVGGGGSALVSSPTSLTTRVTRRFSIGVDVGMMNANLGMLGGPTGRPEAGPDDPLHLGLIGGHLRVSLLAGASRTGNTYWEIFADAGSAYGWLAAPEWSGGGALYSGGLGAYVMSSYLVGLGVTTRFYGGRIGSASNSDTGLMTEVSVSSWHALMLQLVIGV